jgi:hypothetical protein
MELGPGAEYSGRFTHVVDHGGSLLT